MFEPHVERMLTELGKLNERIAALGAFAAGQVFAGIPPVKQALMMAQLRAMQGYATILADRLSLETTQPKEHPLP